MVKPDASILNSPATGKNEVLSPGTFDVGVTTVTYTLTHATGDQESCWFTITVTSKPDITCPSDLSGNTDTGTCTWLVNSGVPKLNQGAQPITWTWTITGPTGVVEATGTSMNTPTMNDYNFNLGTSTITWTATNNSGTATCTHTVKVIDKEAPTFTVIGPLAYCVSNIQNAVYNPTPTAGIVPEYDDLTSPRPEYYLLTAISKLFDLDPTINNFKDNCCATNLLIIHWEIIFAPTPNPASVAHEMITKPAILGQTGQPSAYGDIQFPGDGVTFTNITHHINYWLEDCHGNPASNPLIHTVDIIIQPRPKIIKNP